MIREIVLENLRNLIAEIEAGTPDRIEEKIDSCWRELWERKNESRFSPENLEENQKILTEITVAAEAFLSRYMDIDKLRAIIRKVL